MNWSSVSSRLEWTQAYSPGAVPDWLYNYCKRFCWIDDFRLITEEAETFTPILFSFLGPSHDPPVLLSDTEMALPLGRLSPAIILRRFHDGDSPVDACNRRLRAERFSTGDYPDVHGDIFAPTRAGRIIPRKNLKTESKSIRAALVALLLMTDTEMPSRRRNLIIGAKQSCS